MKKLALGLFAIAITVASIAQTKDKQVHKADKQKSEKHHGHHGKKDGAKGHDFKEKLNLNEDQKEQLKAVREDFHKQLKDLKANTALTQEQKKDRMKELAQQQREKMQAILTPEQRQQAQKMRSEAKDKKKGEGKEKFANHAKKAEKMKEELNLTDAQGQQVKAINEKFRDEMKAIHQNSALTQEQKKEQMKALQQKHKEQLQSLLTTEQKEKVKERVKNHSNRRAVK
jgi:Spy/CpxP family protein refolding chaperone